jgi:hypothetical protein
MAPPLMVGRWWMGSAGGLARAGVGAGEGEKRRTYEVKKHCGLWSPADPHPTNYSAANPTFSLPPSRSCYNRPHARAQI